MKHYDDFDLESAVQEALSEVKPRILVCGVSGAGKSSLVNHLLELQGQERRALNTGEPMTRGVTRVTSPNSPLELYDSEGYEPGEPLDHYREVVLACLEQGDPKKELHEIWYCVPATAPALHDTDRLLLRELQGKGLPLAVIITKIDLSGKTRFDRLHHSILQTVPGVPVFSVCTSPDSEALERVREFQQWDALKEWAVSVLPDTLRGGMVRGLKQDLKETRRMVETKIIPAYGTAAAGAAILPLPLADAAVLTPLQTAMCVQILRAYGMDSIQAAVPAILGGVGLSNLGRSAATSLARLIPGIGIGVTAANTAVASSFTVALGFAVSRVAAGYIEKAKLDRSIPDFQDYVKSIDWMTLVREGMKKK